MATINQLSTASSLSLGDLIAIYSTNNGDARKSSLTTLLTLFQESFAAPEVSTQRVTPTTGFNLAVAGDNAGANVWVLLIPAGTLAAGTLTLPLNTTALDGQEVLVSSTQIITTLTISANGATGVNGAPTALAANGFFKLRFNTDTNSWFRVG